MNKQKAGNEDVTLQVRQVQQALRTVYLDPGLIDDGDLEGMPTNQREPRLLSRALTAQAVRMVTGFSPQEAALTVIDGEADKGIDAIAVVDGPDPHVYLVQGGSGASTVRPKASGQPSWSCWRGCDSSTTRTSPPLTHAVGNWQSSPRQSCRRAPFP